MKKIIIAIIVVAGAYGMWQAGQYGLSKQERAECLQWQSDAKEYANFYLTQWQKDQCDNHKIEIDAPVQQSGILNRMESATPTPTPTATPKPSQTPKTSPVATQTPSPTPTPFVASAPTPTPIQSPTPTPIQSTPAPTPTPSPTPKPDTTAPQIKVFFVTNQQNGTKDTLYYLNDYCRMCILVTSNEPLNDYPAGIDAIFRAASINDPTEEIVQGVEYKGFGSSQVNGQSVTNQYFYLIELPSWNQTNAYFKFGIVDGASNVYTGAWSAFNQDHRIYIW